MGTDSIFTLPVPPAARRYAFLQPRSPRKRRRNGQQIDLEVEDEDTNNVTRAASSEAPSVEYTAVVTPAERSQRRLAGWPLNHAPPPSPFPHAGLRINTARDQQQKSVIAVAPGESTEPVQRKHTLHFQHLAAMTALLHRSMTVQDYPRAARALGLLLRNEVNGRPIDIRSAGLWGMGAEVLLFQGGSRDPTHNTDGQRPASLTWGGFERAKLFYERLTIQHPPSKAWPDAINALDFSIAMFGLWIYVVDHERSRMQKQAALEASIDTDVEAVATTHQKIREWELEQARQIADAMDIRMRDIVFNRSPELIHQRAMVALWLADLLETQTRFDEDEKLQSDLDDEDLSRRIESITFDRHNSPRPRSKSAEVEDNRALAQKLLRKVRGFSAKAEDAGDAED